MLNDLIFKDALEKYTEIFEESTWPKEEFKWIAIKKFQDNWNLEAVNFGDMFTEATSEARNLLDSHHYYPRGMMIDFARTDEVFVRELFRNLYDENQDLIQRIDNFINASEEFRSSQNRPDWRSHYQTHNSVSTYLWLRYPNRYYIYKYSEFREVAKILDSDLKPKKGDIENILKQSQLYGYFKEALSTKKDFIIQYKSLLDEKHYRGETLNTLAFDLAFFISRNYITKDNWFPKGYHPSLDKSDWLKLLSDNEIFNDNAMTLMTRMLDQGGQSSCTELADIYGQNFHFYKNGATALAQRVYNKTQCSLHYDKDGKARWWPILFTGRYALKGEVGDYIWRLRDELQEALVDLNIKIEEVKDFTPIKESIEQIKHWWLTANPKYWSPSSLSVGERHFYTKYNNNGNKRRVAQNFAEAKLNDIIISYESTPEKKIVALLKVTEETDDQNLYFEKVEHFLQPITYQNFSNVEELQNMEFLVNPNGSLFKLTENEYTIIMDLIREENQSNITPNELYTKEELLADVFIEETQYETLVSLINSKKNLILQGPPGVGKTYLAKKLAYSIIGSIDESRVEIIQFHQNYAYEDFVRGYKPTETGFEIENGIFYNLCKKAENDISHKYFLIIDEINRANISKVFGELLMLIENNYRNHKIKLSYGGILFSVPENLYIIGLMNTADRSLALIDYALRRRFSFYNMTPAFNTDSFTTYIKSLDDDLLKQLIDLIKELNIVIRTDESLGTGFEIGHSYFSNLSQYQDTHLIEIVDYDIIPLLEEYWFDDDKKVIEWTQRLRGLFND